MTHVLEIIRVPLISNINRFIVIDRYRLSLGFFFTVWMGWGGGVGLKMSLAVDRFKIIDIFVSCVIIYLLYFIFYVLLFFFTHDIHPHPRPTTHDPHPLPTTHFICPESNLGIECV